MHPIRAGDRFFALPLDGKVLLGDEPLERGESIRRSPILLRGRFRSDRALVLYCERSAQRRLAGDPK